MQENEEIKTQEQIVETEPTNENETHEEVKNENLEATETDVKNDEVKLTQEEVNNLVKDRVNKTKEQFYKRYGVSSREELDDLIGKCQSFDEVKERYDNLNVENQSLKQELAFLKNNIDNKKIDDIKIYFKGKELELNEENLINELSTHPEWVKANTSINTLGVEHKETKREETEDERIKRVFGINY